MSERFKYNGFRHFEKCLINCMIVVIHIQALLDTERERKRQCKLTPHNRHSSHKNLTVLHQVESVDLISSIHLISQCLSLKVNNSCSGSSKSVLKASSPTWDYLLFLTAHFLHFIHSTLIPYIHLSSLGFHLWRMGEVCSWHINTPLTVYIHFSPNPVS